jgi:hypothetical protein
MQVMEIFEPTPAGYRDEKEDNSVISADDTRKTRLTLDTLHRLRIMNDTRKLEHEKKLEKVATQYKAPAQAPGL